jgi:hypothetical protein
VVVIFVKIGVVKAVSSGGDFRENRLVESRIFLRDLKEIPYTRMQWNLLIFRK